jgi:hypothetical protein
MRRTIAVLAFSGILASVAGAVTLLPKTSGPDAGPATATFEVATNDGYGVGECLLQGGECGRSVADAWCQSQGFSRADAYGVRDPEDVTGSVVLVSTARTSRPVEVTCSR